MGKGGFIERTPDEQEYQAQGATRIVYHDVLEDCDIGDGGSIEAKKHIAEYLEWQLPYDKNVMLLARKIHPDRRVKIPDLPALLEQIGKRHPNNPLISTIIKRLNPQQRVRESHVLRDALAIATVMDLMLRNTNISKNEAVARAAKELNMSVDNVRKIPYIKKLPSIFR